MQVFVVIANIALPDSFPRRTKVEPFISNIIQDGISWISHYPQTFSNSFETNIGK
jgi:hypothetical protein